MLRSSHLPRKAALVLVSGLALGGSGVVWAQTPSLSIDDTTVTEGTGGTTVATFTATLTAAQGPGTGICSAPIGLADVSNPTTVVGTGTPGSCTETALRTAVGRGGVITFNCGPNPVTIAITQTLNLRNDIATTIDGGGKITLDAGRRTRIFYYYSGNWMATMTTVTLQRLVLRNGKAPAGTYYPPNPTYPKCAYGYKEGSGGVLFMRDGVLHVIDCAFYDNEAALLGPDVGGGALYLQGASEVMIVDSRFEGNTAANGGAIGMLFANPQIYNSIFENNTAVGIGMNYVEPDCPLTFNHENQGGAGGLSGAVYFDGMDYASQPYTICGSVFHDNRCNELGGALFRTPNVETRTMLIDRSVFDSNTAKAGSVSFIKQNNVTVRESLFSNNHDLLNVDGDPVSGWAGGLWINEGTLNLVNSTFYNNTPGGITVEGSGTLRNATIVSSPLSSGLAGYNSIYSNVACGTTTGADNVQYPSSGSCPSDTLHSDPKLAGLADNGGPTQTMMPAADSPALGIGNTCPTTDQRGATRPANGCDAGAVER
jgi:hypothetical protein